MCRLRIHCLQLRGRGIEVDPSRFLKSLDHCAQEVNDVVTTLLPEITTHVGADRLRKTLGLDFRSIRRWRKKH